MMPATDNEDRQPGMLPSSEAQAMMEGMRRTSKKADYSSQQLTVDQLVALFDQYGNVQQQGQ